MLTSVGMVFILNRYCTANLGEQSVATQLPSCWSRLKPASPR